MKYFFILLTGSLLLSACGNNKADEPISENDSIESSYNWQATLNDSSGKLEMKKQEGGPDSLSPAAMVDFINKDSSSHVHLDLVRISGDTVYIKIPDATHLTQQMGSAGANMFLAEAVYNLTELPGIKYVNLDFEEGDHAAPGTFSRDSFKNE